MERGFPRHGPGEEHPKAALACSVRQGLTRGASRPLPSLRGLSSDKAAGGGWELDFTRLEDNRQALNERLRSHDLGGKLRLSFRPPARDGSQQQGCQLLSRSCQAPTACQKPSVSSLRLFMSA